MKNIRENKAISDRCDDLLLERLTKNELSDVDRKMLEEHLDHCDRCSRKVADFASVGWGWREVAECLAPDEFDADAPVTCDAKYDPTALPGGSEQTDSLLSREISGWLDPTDDPSMLGRFAGYEITGIIGHGGMGIVLKGFESSLNRYVAIKVLAPRLATNGAARKRFFREAQAAAAVRHDNVIAVHRVDDWNGLPFLVMPYVVGQSLQKRIDSEGPLGLEATLRIAAQVASGLAAAHAQGLVHRDIKPANILLENGVERVTITDFGLARTADDASITRTGCIAGTPQFMSPEQAQGDPLDHRSDLFSLGSVMYAMATGRPPFRSSDNREVLRQVAEEAAHNARDIEPSIPDWLADLIGWLQEKSPGKRPQSAQEVADLLNDWLAHLNQPEVVPEPPRCRPAPRQSTSSPPARRRRTLLAVSAGFLAILAGIMIYVETGKGTIRINCHLDGVPVEIREGDRVVESLTVSRDGASVRVAMGEYTVVVGGDIDDIFVRDGQVTLKRGGKHVVTIDRAERTQGTARQKSQQNLARLVRAMHQYCDEHGHWPTAVNLGKEWNDGKPVRHSWRVALLPYLGEQELYDAYDLEESWDSEHNRQLLSKMPAVFRCPLDEADSVNASYFAVVSPNELGATEIEKPSYDGAGGGGGCGSDVGSENGSGMGGPGDDMYGDYGVLAESDFGAPAEPSVARGQHRTLFSSPNGTRMAEILDGTSNTIALVEVKRDIPWTKPEDILYHPDKPLPELGGWFDDGWFAGMADGRTKFVSLANDAEDIRNLLTIDDGQNVTLNENTKYCPGVSKKAEKSGDSSTKSPAEQAATEFHRQLAGRWLLSSCEQHGERLKIEQLKQDDIRRFFAIAVFGDNIFSSGSDSADVAQRFHYHVDDKSNPHRIALTDVRALTAPRTRVDFDYITLRGLIRVTEDQLTLAIAGHRDDYPEDFQPKDADVLVLHYTRDSTAESANISPGTMDALPRADTGSAAVNQNAEEDAAPRSKRWSFTFGQTSAQVVHILSLFNIEIGVAGGGEPDITYIAPLETRSVVRRSPPDIDQRLYVILTGQPLAICRKLAENAGIETDRRAVLLFIRKDLEDELAKLEGAHRDVSETQLVTKTVFGFRPAGDGWEPFVVSQETTAK